MDLKARLKQGLEHSRGFTLKVLSEINNDEEWILRPIPGANHALWITGHLAYATNAFIGLVDPSKHHPREDLKTLFGKGTTPQDDLNAYPPPTEIFELWSERSEAFIHLLDECSEEDLTRDVPKGPGFMHDVAAVFHMAAWHEALHTGQLTVIHRMLGQSPIADR